MVDRRYPERNPEPNYPEDWQYEDDFTPLDTSSDSSLGMDPDFADPQQRSLVTAPVKTRKIVYFIFMGLLVHTIVVNAALEIYFSSPVEQNLTSVKSTDEPVAERIVLIVADGLRADSLLAKGQPTKAPHLTKIRKSRGSWGVAHTRVPTESRPGHVALLAGIYEDPGAIFTGWLGNPVDFDSVINQSRHAWCWGSPNIVHMFNKENLPHIHSYSYEAGLQDFGKKHTSALDLWVFDKLKEFFEKQKGCHECTDYQMSKNIFFLHLLGIDTAGHGFKPKSFEYTENIKVVDKLIPQIENLFETAFPNNSTAYIFTSDHGMTNWGSHGSGSQHETEIPIIAWGAGVKKEDAVKDIRQVDVAPLISALIGINYPVNSIGILPHQYIDTDPENLGKMIISNVRQLMNIFMCKKHRTLKNAIYYTPFRGLTTEEVEEKIQYLEELFANKRYDEMKTEALTLMNYLIMGSDYYHNYYQLPVLIAITIGLISWMIYAATYTIKARKNAASKSVLLFLKLIVFVPLYVITVSVLAVQSLPLDYYLYFLFPIYMVHLLVERYMYILKALKYLREYGLCNAMYSFFLYGVSLKILLITFHARRTLSLIMLFIAGSVLYDPQLKVRTNATEKLAWIICCLLVAGFPLLPVMPTTFNIPVYIFGYLIWWIILHRVIKEELVFPVQIPAVSGNVLRTQLFFFILTPLYTLAVEMNFVAPDSNFKTFACVWTIYPIFIILFGVTNVLYRSTSIMIGFATFYLMVTTNFEVLFLILYSALIFLWLFIESRCYSFRSPNLAKYNEVYFEDRYLLNCDFRRGFFLLVFLFMGYFGAGNVTSLSSFDPMWVRCFFTVFSPFKMSAVILMRIMVPIVFVISVYRAIIVIRRGNMLALFAVVLVFADFMLIDLLFSITNTGSWFEIGASLSQFTILTSFIFMILILYPLTSLLTKIELGF